MRPIPGTITDPRLTPITDRDPGDEQPEPARLNGPKLTPAQWVAVLKMLEVYERLVADYLTELEREALTALRHQL